MKQRIEQLDSLRGLAALSVVVYHFANVFPSKSSDTDFWWNLIQKTPLNFVMAGHQAVIFFFVLSGFVLSIPFYKRPISYIPWITKRFCRIYLPYYGAIALGVLLILFLGPYEAVPALSRWFNRTLQGPITLGTVGDHLLLIGSFRNGQINPIVWSLVVEMRVSLLFPFLMLAVIRMRWWHSLLAAYGVVLLAGAAQFVMLRILDWRNDYCLTLTFLPHFVMGCTLARYQSQTVAWFREKSRTTKAALLLVAVLLYTYPDWFFPKVGLLHLPWLTDDFVTMLGVVLFILAALASTSVSSVLLSRPLVALGKSSYSLYLVHALCLLSVVHLGYDVLPLWALLSLAAILSLAVTAVFYYTLELPSIELGKWAASWIDARRPVSPPVPTACAVPVVDSTAGPGNQG